MPDDVTLALRALTPLAPDRDAILFAAGRGARRWAGWKWLTVALAVLNSVTLGVLLWPQPEANTPPAEPSPVETPPAAPTRPDPHSYIALQRGWDAPPAFPGDAGVPPASPPLTPRAIHDPSW